MIFDIGFFLLLIIFMLIGYKKGLVSMILSIGMVALSFVLAMYISYRWNFIQVEVFGVWIQTFVLFAIFSGISQWLISKIEFEELAIVGLISRILGGLLHGIIFAVIALAITAVIITFSPNIQISIMENSLIVAWLKELITKIDISQLEMLKFF